MDALALTPSPGFSSRFDQTRHIGRRPVTLGAVGQILRWRWRLILGVMLVMLAAGVAASLLIPPRYEGVARVRIMPSNTFAAPEDGEQGRPLDQALVNTEVATILSRDVARRVVEQNGLASDGEFVGAALLGANRSQARASEAAITSVLAHLTVEQQDKSYILAIHFQSRSGEKAARVANSFASAYIDNTADLAMSTAARQATTGEAALQRLSAQAEQAAANAAQYKASAGIVQGGAGGTINDQQIGPLAMQLATAQAQAAAARSNVAAAEREIGIGGGDAVAAVLSSSVIADLRRQRTEAESTRAQLSARYGPRFPALMQNNQQIAALDSQIHQEQGRIIEGLKNEARAADAQVASLRAQMGSLKGEVSANNQAAVKADSLQRSADAATTAYNRLSSSVQSSVQAERSNEPQARMVEQAVVAAHPAFPNRPALIAASLLLGAIMGFAAALVTEGMQSTLRHADDVETLLGVPFIASVPQVSGKIMAQAGYKGASPADTLIARPVSAFSEAFRSIRQTLRGHHAAQGAIIAVSSTLPSEGKTTSALSLARVMAMGGDRVLLIDGDLRRAGLACAARVEVTHDLVDVISGKAQTHEAITPDIVERLDLLVVREPTFSAVDLFSGTIIKAELNRLRAQYDFIIIDTPPLLGIADARSLAGLADGVLLLVRWGVTPIAAVDAALAGLEKDGSPVIGAVLTMVDPHADAMGGHYYSAHYANYYAA